VRGHAVGTYPLFAGGDNTQQCQQKSGGLAVAVLEAWSTSKSRPPTGAFGSAVTLGSEINKSSSISGPTLVSHTIGIDAAKPDPAVESCARLRDSHLGCSVFDISVVYGKCRLYRSVEKSTELDGYISATAR
jgi:hypothetical protein